MGKFLKIVGGLVVALFVIGALAGSGSKSGSTTTSTASTTSASSGSSSKASAAAAVALLGVGSSAQAGNWKIDFQQMNTATTLGSSRFSKGTSAQGKFVVLTLAATNLHKETSNLNSWDFKLRSADGVAYDTSTDGEMALIGDENGPKTLSLADQVQPGLTKPFRLVFDVNPSVHDYTLEAAGVKFKVSI